MGSIIRGGVGALWRCPAFLLEGLGMYCLDIGTGWYLIPQIHSYLTVIISALDTLGDSSRCRVSRTTGL